MNAWVRFLKIRTARYIVNIGVLIQYLAVQRFGKSASKGIGAFDRLIMYDTKKKIRKG